MTTSAPTAIAILGAAILGTPRPDGAIVSRPTSEPTIRAKAAALGAALPAFRMCEAPEMFATWADRVAQADSLRHAGKPYDAAVAECDRQLGLGKPVTAPVVVPDGLGLGWLAAALGDVAAPAVVVA